jgi:hypothetical protein
VAERRAAAPHSPRRPKGGDAHTRCYIQRQVTYVPDRFSIVNHRAYILKGNISAIFVK